MKLTQMLTDINLLMDLSGDNESMKILDRMKKCIQENMDKNINNSMKHYHNTIKTDPEKFKKWRANQKLYRRRRTKK